MKTLLVLFSLLFLGLSAFPAQSEAVRQPVNPPYAFARGFSNLMFGWLEVPRGIVYENARIPVVGFVSGSIKGAALTTWRTLSGTMDIVAMGLTRDGLHTPELMPDFVWDAPWVPRCGATLIPYTDAIVADPCTCSGRSCSCR